MTQQPKKPATAPGARPAAAAANKVTQTAFTAAESTQKAAQNVVNIGTNAVREMLASGTGEAQKVRDQAWEMGRESAENLARATDIVSRMYMEFIGIMRGNVEAMIECASITANAYKEMTTEFTESCNRSFADCVEIGKEAFGCRTVNDLVELQNRAVKQAVDSCFSETNRLCTMAFECASDALEPINDRVSEASEKFAKAIAA